MGTEVGCSGTQMTGAGVKFAGVTLELSVSWGNDIFVRSEEWQGTWFDQL
jgi:hypothetical protein